MIFGMNKNIFKLLCMNYNREADKNLYQLWLYNLRCYDEEEVKKAANIIISQDKFFPTLSRMLEVLKDIVKKEDFEDYNSERTVRKKLETLSFKPEWYGKEIKNQEIDESTQREIEDFNNFIKEFRQ